MLSLNIELIYAALFGGIVAAGGVQFLAQRAANKRTRIIDSLYTGVKELASIDKGEDAAEVAAREAREQVKLDEFKAAVAKLSLK